MLIFRTFLVVLWVILIGYTGVVVSTHGFGLLPIFFGDMASFTWPGQFNLDFMFMLLLSGLWVLWRHQFSKTGFALGLLACFGGSSFLAVYLLVLTIRCSGDMKHVLLGNNA